MPKPTEEQLAKINRLALTPLTEEECMVFPNMMIDNQITSYSSRLHPNLLRTFVKDASKGVGLLLSHDSRRLPVGRSFSARMLEEYDDEVGDVVTSVYGDFYIALGRQTESGMSTDDIAKGIETGTIYDTSIGFNASTWECSICGNDIRDWRSCSHFPGEKYIVQNDGPNGEIVDEVVTCIVEVGSDGEGELLENSLVYAGACGRAKITSNFSTDGVRETQKGTKLHLVNNIKNIPLDAAIYTQYSSSGECVLYSNKPENVAVPDLGNTKTDGSEEKVKFEKFKEVLDKFSISVETPDQLSTKLSELTALQGKLTEKEQEVTEFSTKLAEKETELESVKTQLSTKDETITELTAKNEELTSKAELAETYRNDLTEQALALGVRAQGNAFNKELYAKFLGTLSVDEIKGAIKGFEAEVEARFEGSKTTATKKLKAKGGEPQTREDFETEEEFRNYVADKAMELSKSEGMSLKDATAQVYHQFKGGNA